MLTTLFNCSVKYFTSVDTILQEREVIAIIHYLWYSYISIMKRIAEIIPSGKIEDGIAIPVVPVPLPLLIRAREEFDSAEPVILTGLEGHDTGPMAPQYRPSTMEWATVVSMERVGLRPARSPVLCRSVALAAIEDIGLEEYSEVLNSNTQIAGELNKLMYEARCRFFGTFALKSADGRSRVPYTGINSITDSMRKLDIPPSRKTVDRAAAGMTLLVPGLREIEQERFKRVGLYNSLIANPN